MMTDQCYKCSHCHSQAAGKNQLCHSLRLELRLESANFTKFTSAAQHIRIWNAVEIIDHSHKFNDTAHSLSYIAKMPTPKFKVYWTLCLYMNKTKSAFLDPVASELYMHQKQSLNTDKTYT